MLGRLARFARRALRALSGEASPAIDDRERQALRSQVKFTSDLFESVPVALSLRDREGRYLFVNRTWERYFGSKREEVLGRSPRSRVSEEEAAQVLALDRAALERGPGGVASAEFDHRGRRYTQTRSVMADEQGRVSGVLTASLDTTEQHATNQRLRDQIALTEAIVRQIPNATFTKDAAGRFTMVNRGWSEMSGVPAERAVGRTVHDIYPPELARRFAEEDARLIAQGAAAEPTEAEHSGPRPGQWRIVKKAVLSRDDGTVMGLVATSTDISELKRVQAALADRAKLESDLVDALPISVALRDTECRFVQVNRTWERYFGIRREDAIGKRFSELPGWQDNPELVKVAGEAEAIDRELMARGPHAAPLLFEDTRLGRSYLLGRQIFTDAAGRVTGLIATGVDTSELRAAQRALALERERLALLVRSTRAGFSEWDAETDVVTYSERFKEMLGHAADADTSAWRIFDLMHPDDGPRVLEKFRAMIQARAGATAHEPAEAMEYRLRRADGGYLWVRAEGLVQRDDAGRAARFITSYIDITALREQERSLRDQMVLTSALFDDNPNAMYVKDAQGRYVTVNDAWLKMVGVTREQAIGHTVLELFREKESERYHAEDMRLIAQGEGVSEMESLRTGPDGRPQWVIIRKRVLRRADGTLVGLIGTNTDITPLKRIEAELAERAKFVAELVDAMPISVAMRDTEGRYMLVNRAWERYFGVSRDAALGKRRRELPGWPADPQRLADAEEIERLDREMLARGPDYTPEPQETLRLGRYYLMTRRALSDSSGKPIGVVSAGIDMTERRTMEEALAAERQRLALVVSAAQAGIIDWDTAGETAWFSERFKEMLGYAADADTSEWGNIFGALIHPEDRDRSREVFLAGLMSTGAPNSTALQEPLELRLRCADGSWLWVESHGITLRDEAGEAKRYLAAVTDIGKRRAQDEALRNQVKFINDLFDSVPLSLAMRDPEGRFLYVNRTWETYLGMKRDAVLGKSLYQVMPQAEADAIFADDRNALERGSGAPIELSEFRFRERSLMQTRTVMSDAQGRTIGLLVASIDVSERRAMEEALAFERRRLELVVRAFQIGIVDWDGRTHAVFYSPRFREIRGYAPDADTSQWPDYFKVLIHPEDRDRVTARWRN
ncbi:MAG TPA: PAS domain S-box protein, partial [Burkholderiales bacterium]